MSDAARAARAQGDTNGRYAWALISVLAFSVLLRVRLAAQAYWDVDETAALWRSSLLRAGREPLIGLPSSTGFPHLAGAEVLLMPVSWLSDLTHVGIAVSLMQLAALATLAWHLGDNVRGRIWPTLVLTCLPSLIGISVSPRHQYLSVGVEALFLTLLLRLWRARSSSQARAVEAALAVSLCAFLPAVHIMWFPQSLLQLAAVAVTLTRNPVPARTLAAWLLVLVTPVATLYVVWLPVALRSFDANIAHKATPALVLVPLLAIAWRGRRQLSALFLRRQWLTRTASVLGIVAIVGVALSVAGPPVTRWPLRVGTPRGLVFAGVQLLLLVPALPVLLHLLRGSDAGAIAEESALLLVVGGMGVLAGFAVTHSLYLPSGRMDFSHALLVAPLAAFALVSARGWPRIAAGTLAGVFLFGCTVTPRSPKVEARFRQFIPASEMRDAVDWIAATQQARGAGDNVDVSYELARFREWIPGFAKASATPSYTVGRPLDWLFRQRHHLRNAHEGQYDRAGPAEFVFRYRDEVAAGDANVRYFPHIAVQVSRNDEERR